MSDDRSRREISRLTGEVIPALIARLGDSSLGELEVRQDGWRVRIRRNGTEPELVTSPELGPARRISRSSAEGRDRSHGAPDSAAGRAVGPGRERVREGRARTATSPAVGYYVPAQDLATGRSVEAGDVLGHVDVLGVRQEIVAPVAGIISRLLAQSGEAVEYGQELAQIEARQRGGEGG